MDELPDGWVPLSRFDSRDRGRSGGHSPHYKILVTAVRDGVLRGLKDPKSRRCYVRLDAANQLLDSITSKEAEKPDSQPDGQHEPACEQLADICSGMSRIAALLERLVTAVELLATQPQVCGHEGVQTINGNLAPWNET